MVVFSTAASAQTPAQRHADEARRAIASRPHDAAGHRELAVAHARRARETADGAHYARALAALATAREHATAADRTGLDAVEAWVRLGRHEFAAAEQLARRALERAPDDETLHGLLGDALMEQGRYDHAEAAYQRMLDLRPGPAAYVRAAHYREIRGDYDGALALWRSALEATPGKEGEDRAWLLVQAAGAEAAMGRAKAAAALHRRALDSFPGYHAALTGLARLTLDAADAERALPLARAAYAAAPHPEHRLLVADALHALGREAEAREQERAFESEALGNIENPDNENVYLVDFYLDRRDDPARALEIARREAKRRADVGTLVRLARALDRNGESAEARALMRRVLAVGTRDPEILRHASALGVETGS